MDTDQHILDIIESEAVGDQATLLARLEARGLSLTQPTLSRHLRKLSVRKRQGRYQVTQEAPALLPRMDISLVPPNLIVLKTDPGHGQMLALHLDKRSPEGMAGTVAGDDTIFIAAAEGASLEGLKQQVLAVFGLGDRGASPQ